MTINSLINFGTLRRTYKGKGIISFSNGNELPTQFTLAQRSDGQLLLSADVNLSTWEFATNNIEAQSLTGTLLDGSLARVSGPIFLKAVNPIPRTNKARLIAYPSNWIFGNPNFNEPASISFELVNFRFWGTEYKISSNNESGRKTLSVMPLALGNRNLQLQQTPDYEQVDAILQARHGIEVTCTATTTLGSNDELSDVISTVETLCDVMSVARATLVSWVSFEVASSHGMPIYSQARNSVTRRFTGNELIGCTNFHQTKEFIERGFLRCRELDPDFQTRRIARAYTETREGPFIESRSLLIAVLAEYLAGVRARLDKRLFFMDEGIFAAGWNSLKDTILSALRTVYPKANDKYLSVMLGNVKGLINRRPLSWRLNNLAKWLNLRFDTGEVEKFITPRNKLAHEGSFPEDANAAVHYLRMQHFLDRIMLRLFDYHGSYYDFEHGEYRQI
jgi:hypothetical protein